MIDKVSVIEYAILANDVYYEKTRLSTYGDIIWRDESYNIEKIIFQNNISSNYKNAFFARLYVKRIDGIPVAAVIAYRGTQPLTHLRNDIDDIEIALGNNPQEEDQAMAFYNIAGHYIFSLGLEPRLTGHSLGGALAQIVAIKSNQQPQTVTFNAPGIAQIHGIKSQQQYPYIHNYNVKLDVINKAGKTLGDITWLEVPNEKTEAIIGKSMYENSDAMPWVIQNMLLEKFGGAILEGEALYPQHKMENLITALKQSPTIALTSF